VVGQAAVAARTAAAPHTEVPPGKFYEASTAATRDCPQGTYRPGHSRVDAAAAAACIACPCGSVTRQSGTASVDDCVVPPGYFVRASAAAAWATDGTTAGDGDAAAAGEMVKCPTTPAGSTEEGYYRCKLTLLCLRNTTNLPVRFGSLSCMHAQD
jgi:hypothetical protein